MSNIVLMDDDKPKVIGSGSIGTADPPSAGNLGAFFWETGDPNFPNGRLWQYKSLFKNDGQDDVKIDNTTINDNLRPMVDSITIRFKVKFNSLTSVATYLFSKDNGDPITSQQLTAYFRTNTPLFNIRVGGVDYPATFTVSLGVWYDVVFTMSNTTAKTFVNGVQYHNVTLTGNYTTTMPLRICGYAPNVLYNSQMDTCDWEFFSSYTSTGSTASLSAFAKYALNEPNGTVDIYDSISGLKAVVTDLSPVGALGNLALSPVQWLNL